MSGSAAAAATAAAATAAAAAATDVDDVQGHCIQVSFSLRYTFAQAIRNNLCILFS